jgi:nucleoside 2-deoxyribosyltransferase
MLIYLAAPIESDVVNGNAFRLSVKDNLVQNPLDNVVLFDPFMPYEYKDIKKVGLDIKNANRAVLRQSDLVVALLAGCETWREIEHAATLEFPPRIWGVWPKGAHRSPIATLDITVFDSVEEMMLELHQP